MDKLKVGDIVKTHNGENNSISYCIVNNVNKGIAYTRYFPLHSKIYYKGRLHKYRYFQSVCLEYTLQPLNIFEVLKKENIMPNEKTLQGYMFTEAILKYFCEINPKLVECIAGEVMLKTGYTWDCPVCLDTLTHYDIPEGLEVFCGAEDCIQNFKWGINIGLDDAPEETSDNDYFGEVEIKTTYGKSVKVINHKRLHNREIGGTKVNAVHYEEIENRVKYEWKCPGCNRELTSKNVPEQLEILCSDCVGRNKNNLFDSINGAKIIHIPSDIDRIKVINIELTDGRIAEIRPNYNENDDGVCYLGVSLSEAINYID